jgi:uncharacterized protein YggT (Ycf19 family)
MYFWASTNFMGRFIAKASLPLLNYFTSIVPNNKVVDLYVKVFLTYF